MESIVTTLTEETTKLLSNNDFFQGGLILGILGAIAAYARNVPSKIYQFIKKQITFSVIIEDRDNAYYWLMRWFEENLNNKRKKQLICFTTFGNDITENKGTSSVSVDTSNRNEDNTIIFPNILFKPNSGHFLIRYKSKFILINIDREKMQGSGDNLIIKFYETITFSLFSFGTRSNLITELIREAYLLTEKPEIKTDITIYSSQYDHYVNTNALPLRKQNSLILVDNLYNELFQDIQSFLNNRKWYEDKGIIWKRGYGLYGPPGNGKTSLIQVIASELRMNIYTINLNSVNSDVEFSTLLRIIPPRNIILIEDIDAAFNNRITANKDSKLTFSGVLNNLDGVSTKPGRLLFITTNHLDHLDFALVRPGRIDRLFKIENATKEQIRGMFEKFFIENDISTDGFLKDKDYRYSMAQIQEHLCKYKNSFNDAVKNLSELETQRKAIRSDNMENLLTEACK